MNGQVGGRRGQNNNIVVIDGKRVELADISSYPDARSVALRKLENTHIDLSAVSSPSLKDLTIKATELVDIDLGPLHACTDLSTLVIAVSEGLEQIDLTPLSSCARLSTLDLSMNSLKEIDLSPFCGHRGLAVLNLTMNEIREIDLQSLKECPNLQILWLGWNPLDLRKSPNSNGCVCGIDFSGFDRLEKLKAITIEKVAQYFDWSVTTDFVIDITDIIGCPKLKTFIFDSEDVTLLARVPKYNTRLPQVFKKWKDLIVYPGYR